MQSSEEFQKSVLNDVDLSLLQDGAHTVFGNSSRCIDDCISLDWRSEGFTPEV